VTVADLLTEELRRDGARPFLTWYDDAFGDRVELSVTTLANWAAKTANLLADEHGVEPGSPVVLAPADHWLAQVAALGAWTAGACVDLDGSAAGLVLPGDPAGFLPSVLPQPDALLCGPVPPSTLALRAGARTWTAAELAAAARDAATAHGLGRGARVLSTQPLDSIDGLDASLLVPLAAGGSVVWVVNADEARLPDRAHRERVTHTAGVTIAGLPRLGDGAQHSQ
jgi:hypothetical protein